jgi:hypothetical protein
MLAAVLVASARAILTFEWSDTWPETIFGDTLSPRMSIALRFNEAVQAGSGSFNLVSGSSVLSTSVADIAFGQDATDPTKGVVVIPPFGEALLDYVSYAVGIPTDLIRDGSGKTLPAVDPNYAQKVYVGCTTATPGPGSTCDLSEPVTNTVPFVITTDPSPKSIVNEFCVAGMDCRISVFYSELVEEGSGTAGMNTAGTTGVVALYKPDGVKVTGVDVKFRSSEGTPSNALDIWVPASYLEKLAGQKLSLSIYPGAVINDQGSACAKYKAYFYVGVNLESYTPETVEATVAETVTVQFTHEVKFKTDATVTLRPEASDAEDIVVPREKLRLERTNYERSGRGLAVLLDQPFTASETYEIIIDDAVTPVLPKVYVFTVKGASAKDYTPPTLLTLHPALKTDDESSCTKKMENCAFYALFSECVSITGALLTPSHESLDLTFGTSAPYVFGQDFQAFPQIPCSDSTAGPSFSAYWRLEALDRFLSGRQYLIEAMNYTDMAGNAGDQASLAEVQSVIPPMIVRYYPNETEYAHARTTLYIEYLDDVAVAPVSMSTAAKLSVSCVKKDGSNELTRDYDSASKTLKYVTKFIIIGDEWTSEPGGSKELTCTVSVNPDFAQYDLQDPWYWSFSTRVSDFAYPETLFKTRSVNAPLTIGEAHDEDVPVFSDLKIVWNEEIYAYNGTLSGTTPGLLRMYVELEGRGRQRRSGRSKTRRLRSPSSSGKWSPTSSQ